MKKRTKILLTVLTSVCVIACANSLTFEKNEQVDENTVVTIYRDAEHPSKITLPIIPN